MRILVPIKRVVDPYVKIQVRQDNTGVETENVKMVINPFDEIALEQALCWQEQNIATEVVVVSIGEEIVEETLRNGLALGADSALHIKAPNGLEPLTVAKCLKAVIEQKQPDIVIMGKQAIDDDCNQTGQMLASLLDWPQATFASKIECKNDQSSLEITREVDGGLEIVSVTVPCVITTDLRLNEPRYATLPNIMKAKQKPIEKIDIEALGVTVTPRHEIIRVVEPPVRTAGKKVKDVDELVHYLRDVEKVI